MRNNKKLLLILLSLGCVGPAFAAGAGITTNSPISGGVSNAIAFAMQAGQIAGSAQGCSLNIATFSARANEAINKLALNPTDSTAASATFQQALQKAAIIQRNNNTIPCSQVAQDFNNLPLLKPDYQQSVIAQLNPGMASDNQTANSGTTNSPTTAASNNNLNQQQNLTSQTISPTRAANSTTPNNANGNQTNNATNPNIGSSLPNNPAYSQQNYGASRSFNNNYPGAVKPYNMPTNNSQSSTSAPTQPATNNPAPPSFSNPNNSPSANGGNQNQYQ